MARFSCENILDIEKTRAGQSPYEVLTLSQKSKIQRRIEKIVRQHETKLDADLATIDAIEIGGPEGLTALEHVVNDVMKEQLKDVVAQFKPAFIEANRATREIKAVKEGLLFHINNFREDLMVKKIYKSIGRDVKNDKLTIKDLEKADMGKLVGKFFDSIISQNEYGKGHLDRLIQSTAGIHWGRMIDEPMAEKHGWNWWDKIGMDADSSKRLLTELNAMAKDPAYMPKMDESIEQDFMLFARQSVNRMVDENNIVGGKMSHFNLAVKPLLNKFKIEKYIKKNGREQTIQRLVDAYDDATVINIFKHDKAREQYNPITESIEMRLGNKALSETEILKYKRLLAENDIDTVLQNKADLDFIDDLNNTNFRIFKDGELHHAILKDFTQEDSFHLMWVQFNKLSRNHALVKKFGARPREWFRKFEQGVKNDLILKQYTNLPEYRDLEAGIKSFVDNRQIAVSRMGRFLIGVKNLQVLKLGGIPFEQFFQETFFAFLRMKQNEGYKGWNVFKFMAFDSFTTARNNPKAAMRFARYDQISIEAMQGALANRFFGGDLNAQLQMGDIVTKTRQIANRWLQYTQSTALSDMQAMKSYGYLKGDMHDFLLKANRMGKNAGMSAYDWAFSQKEYKTRMLELTEQGIGRDLFNQTARDTANGNIVDSRTKHFDPFLISNQTKPLQARGQTAYDVWMSYFQNKVDGMGRMKANQYQLEKFLWTVKKDDPEAMMIKGALFQFASFQLGFHQRVYLRDMKLGGYGRVATSFALLTSGMYIGAITNCQVRQAGRGNGLYSWTDPQLHKCAFLRTGTLGKWAVMPFIQMLPELPFLMKSEDSPPSAIHQAIRRTYIDGYGPALSQMIEMGMFGVGTLVGGALGYNPKDLAVKFGSSVIDTIKPSMPGLNYFIDMLTDMYDAMFDPKAYRRSQKRKAKENAKRVTPEEFLIKEPKKLLEWIEDNF